MSARKEIDAFLESWKNDPLQAKPVFIEYLEDLESMPGVSLSFKGRPGVSYSLRARSDKQKADDQFVLVDVVDDEPDNRWLSVCFYAAMVTDPDEIGDFVPSGLLGEDALCFNLDEDDPDVKAYIASRIREAAKSASR